MSRFGALLARVPEGRRAQRGASFVIRRSPGASEIIRNTENAQSHAATAKGASAKQLRAAAALTESTSTQSQYVIITWIASLYLCTYGIL